jgi:hypothetical protein
MEMNPSAALVGKFNTAMPQLSQKDTTIKEMMIAGQVLQAIKGNVGAFLALQRLLAEENRAEIDKLDELLLEMKNSAQKADK